MKLTKERRNEIAWLLIVGRLRREGLQNLNPNEFRREVRNQAKDLGVKFEEGMAFAKEALLPLVNELLKDPRKDDKD